MEEEEGEGGRGKGGKFKEKGARRRGPTCRADVERQRVGMGEVGGRKEVRNQ